VLLLSVSTLFAQSGPGFLPSPVRVVSTVPANGDVNPYGVAFVPPGFPAGVLNPGDILVSNFNNSQNLQGTGTTIIRIPQSGASTLFFQSPPQHAGLSTALAVLSEGYVMVGSFPTADGTCATAQPGSLLIINSVGQLVGSVANGAIDGPWDMTIHDFGGGRVDAFVANALSGSISRLNFQVSNSSLSLTSQTIIATGYLHRCDPAALVVAPTGLVYNPKTDTLYVSSTDDNAVYAVSQASARNSDGGRGNLIYQDQTHLHGALAMAQAPNFDLLVSNSDVINQDPNQPSEIVEFTTAGQFVKELPIDPNLGGSFGLNVQTNGATSTFAAVDDNASTLNIWTLPSF
jgi:hypothetical protein